MPRRIVDLTTPIKTDHFRWTVDRRLAATRETGGYVEASWIGWPIHGFTHLDARSHFEAGGETTDDIALEQVIGDAAVIDVSSVGPNGAVDADVVAAAGAHMRPGDIVLLRSGWDRVASIDTVAFWTTAPYVTNAACAWIRERGAKAIAFDFPQDKCIRDFVTGDRRPAFEENTSHIELLLRGVPMFEYLCNMTEIRGDRVQFFGLPLKIPACDGAPVRAIAIEEA